MHSTGRTNSSNRRAAGPPSTFGTADPAANTHRDDAENDRLNDTRRTVISHREREAGSSSTALEWAGVAEVVTNARPCGHPESGCSPALDRAPPTLTAAESDPGTRHQQHEDVAGIGQASRRRQPAMKRSPNATTYTHARAAGRRPGEGGPGPHRPGSGQG